MFISLQIVAVKKKNIHRGEVLARVAATTDLSVIQIARRAGYKTRGSFYDHVKNPDLSYSILEKYAKVLGHDFSEDIPDMPKNMLEEEEPLYNTPATLEEALKIIEQWKNKFIKLSIQYQELSKKVNKEEK